MGDVFTTYVIASIVGIIVTYFLIKAAAKSAFQEANQDLTNLIVTQNRMLAKLLNEKGVPKEDIEKLYSESKEDFWNGLKSTGN